VAAGLPLPEAIGIMPEGDFDGCDRTPWMILFMDPSSDMEKSPWLCHICDFKSDATASRTCAICYRTTCALHLRPASIYNAGNGLYETAEVCISCGASR
jgi:hypothetical protein